LKQDQNRNVEGTSLVKYSSLRNRPIVTADGQGVVNHVVALLLSEMADWSGITDGFSDAMNSTRRRRSGHDSGVVLRHLAVTIANGGDCITDLSVLRGQEALFGRVASDVTAWRTVAKRAPTRLAELRATRARARERAWGCGAAPKGRLTVDFDSTLVDSHSEKEWAAGTYKRGFGFHPLVAYVDVSGQSSPEPLAGILRRGDASPGEASDHMDLLEEVLAQLPEPWCSKESPKLARSDSAGASHDFVTALRSAGFQFSIGLPVQAWVREAIFAVPESEWVPALDQEGEEREGAEVCELRTLNLASWPEGTRAICRRERAHPGAQLRLWEEGRGIRHQVFITDQTDTDVAVLEARHRCRARIEDGIRCAKATGLTNFPSTFAGFNHAWLELLLTGQCLLAWTQRLCLSGEAQIWEPKRLRQSLLHTAARVVRTGRRTIIRLQQDWPWSFELARAFTRLRALPSGT
jgi:Transposase DDE domain group 1